MDLSFSIKPCRGRRSAGDWILQLSSVNYCMGEVLMTQLPHVLKRVRLNLARSKELPSGSDKHGYENKGTPDARQ
jgi:hypothetical protein